MSPASFGLSRQTDPEVWIEQEIAAFMCGPDNDLHMPGGYEPAFGEALVGFAAGSDLIWTEYKKHVGFFHWTPQEAFALAFPETSVQPEELSVISWILPQTSATRRDHRKKNTFPAERWVRARIMGEEYVNNGIRKHMLTILEQAGIQAAAPVLMPQWGIRESDRFVFASTWSERHAAYAAGLGTFGLCDGLITSAGKSMRTGSILVRLKLTPTTRPYSSHREYCLFFSYGICGKCIKRCPAGALSEKGHDKRLCAAYIKPVTADYVKERFGFEGYGCGFCQVGVPCESGIPPRPRG